ncbi:methyltransferase [Galdieria sulphuraria]|uniref:Methyltransferase n=1 Tax=Galdieria sulphuraria TaxID=130081 RepID=M2Y8V6_GALSU|nr:methyltransferase [Galdieria sulphuraria]EME32508.1 methyltransferase [Galdieria sulphuraria]|eukprot:XP_005709028.1 methyltransferase [Galdieria sulphuraria]
MFFEREQLLLLDVGCGRKGSLSHVDWKPRSLPLLWLGVDKYRDTIYQFLRVAKKSHIIFEGIVASACALPFREEVFDTILCQSVLHHFPIKYKRQLVWKNIQATCLLKQAFCIYLTVCAYEQEGKRLASQDALVSDIKERVLFYHFFKRNELEEEFPHSEIITEKDQHALIYSSKNDFFFNNGITRRRSHITSVYALWCRLRQQDSLQAQQQDELSTLCTALWKDLSRYELNLKKLLLVGKTTLYEDQQLQSTERQIQKDIQRVQLEVEELKRQLQVERTQRRRKEEYSLIASSILELPDREKLQEEFEQTTKQIQQLEEQKQQLEYEKEQRARQFQLLLQSIKELSSETDDGWYSWWKHWFASNTVQQNSSISSYESTWNKENESVRMEDS